MHGIAGPAVVQIIADSCRNALGQQVGVPTLATKLVGVVADDLFQTRLNEIGLPGDKVARLPVELLRAEI